MLGVGRGAGQELCGGVHKDNEPVDVGVGEVQRHIVKRVGMHGAEMSKYTTGGGDWGAGGQGDPKGAQGGEGGKVMMGQ